MKTKRAITVFIVTCLLITGNTGELQAAKKKSKKLPGFTLLSQNTAPTNQNVRVSIKLGKGVKVKQILWKKGKSTQSADKYWKKAKNITKIKAFTVSSNGWYSVRIKDKKNRMARRTIQITNIDKQAPEVGKDYHVQNRVATVSVAASDVQNGVSFIGYAKGYLSEKRNLAVYTPMLVAVTSVMVPVFNGSQPASHQFTVNEPGYYTICVKDGVGNVGLSFVYVQLWSELNELKPFDAKSAKPLEGTFFDRWENSFTNPVGFYADTEAKTYVEYFLNGGYTSFSGIIMRGKGLRDESKVWLEIYADDILLYTSEQMDYKNRGVSFDVSLSNAKYIKIKAVSDNWNDKYWYSTSNSSGLYIVNGRLWK